MTSIRVEGLEVSYRSPVDPRRVRGERVVYVHGTGCDARVWDRHTSAIAERHTPVAVDLPGHGESTGGGFRGVADHAHVVVSVADGLGWDRFIIAGHSLGGGVALAAAIYEPSRVRGLLLVDTGARLRVAPETLEHARACAAGEDLPPPDPRLGFAPSTPQDVVDRVHEITEQADPAVTYRDWIADDTCDFTTRVSKLPVRSLAIVGREDALTPVRYAEFFRDKMPDCQMTVIPDAGHWTFWEQPERFDEAVLDFLDSA